MGASRFPSDAHDEDDQRLIVDRGSTCYGQGFHLARPMAPERIPEVLRAR